MKLLFKLVVNTFGYGFVLNKYIVLCLEYTSQKKERNMLVAEKFIRSLVSKYGKHIVYTDGGTWYDEACKILKLKHDLHSSIEKSLMERVNQYFKDRNENFDDYYPCIQKDECNLFHVHNSIQFFVYMYNNTMINNNDFGLKEVNIILNEQSSKNYTFQNYYINWNDISININCILNKFRRESSI